MSDMMRIKDMPTKRSQDFSTFVSFPSNIHIYYVNISYIHSILLLNKCYAFLLAQAFISIFVLVNKKKKKKLHITRIKKQWSAMLQS